MHVLFLEPATINKQEKEREGTYKKVVVPASPTGNRLPITFSSFLYHQSLQRLPFTLVLTNPLLPTLCARRITPERPGHPHGKTEKRLFVTPQAEGPFSLGSAWNQVFFIQLSLTFKTSLQTSTCVLIQLDNSQSLTHNSRTLLAYFRKFIHKTLSQQLGFTISLHTHTRHTITATMFPAECLPSNYFEARVEQEKALQMAAAEKKPTHLAQPMPQRPTVSRALSSALFSFFPSSTATSPSATPMPSPGLQQSAKMSWFAPLPKASEADIAVSLHTYPSVVTIC